MFGGFTFASEVLLGRIAAFYGLSIPKRRMQRLLPISSAPGCRGNQNWATTSASQTKGSDHLNTWTVSGSPRLGSSLILRSRLGFPEHRFPPRGW